MKSTGAFKKTIFHISFILTIGLFVSACSPIVYYPKALNVPLLSDSGEIQANIVTGGGLGIQGSYALNHKFGVTATCMGGAPSFITYQELQGIDRDNYFEVGGIYYRCIGSKVWAEGIGAFGINKRTANTDKYFFGDLQYPTHLNMNVLYSKSYIQGNLGVNGKIAELIISGRFGMLNFERYNFKWQNMDENGNIAERGIVNHHSPALFFEPGITLRLGYKNFKVYGQFCYASLLNNNMGKGDPNRLTDAYNPSFVAIGISTRFRNKSYSRD